MDIGAVAQSEEVALVDPGDGWVVEEPASSDPEVVAVVHFDRFANFARSSQLVFLQVEHSIRKTSAKMTRLRSDKTLDAT